MADPFEAAILRLTAKTAPGESIGPAEVAREMAQETGVEWEQLLKAVRRAAVSLAMDGRAVILLKGEVVDPESFRGIYRIGGQNYLTPRKIEPHHAVRHAPLAPAHDFKPVPRPYTPPVPVAAPSPPAAKPAPVANVRIEVRRPAPPPTPAQPPLHVVPALPAAPPPVVAVAPPPPPPLPPIEPEPEVVEAMVDDALLERDFAAEIESAFEAALIEREQPRAEPEPVIDEGTPVTRFEYAAPVAEVDEEEDFLGGTELAEEIEDEPLSPLPPLPPSLSFDDEGYDEDAGRAPRSATLDDIASQLERYLAAELNNPSRGNAEIGDDIVGLPGEQDK